MRFLTRILRKTCIKLIGGSAKGPCSPKTGQKVVFLEGEKGFSKNPLSKGISDPKAGLKRAKGLSGPTLQAGIPVCLSGPAMCESRHLKSESGSRHLESESSWIQIHPYFPNPDFYSLALNPNPDPAQKALNPDLNPNPNPDSNSHITDRQCSKCFIFP